MSVVTAGGELELLDVYFGWVHSSMQPPILSAWLSSSSLQLLHYGGYNHATVKVASLEGLPALRELSLYTEHGAVRLGDGEEAGGSGPCPPATLTRLMIEGRREEGLPLQVNP